ncbi:thermonuclease family protein [uncultured Paraglaciecola sp.]|uniref:thermonuclease family protein n=1 Tax=uncultured Paraglaciecola sp. TaxID=1765024 RepID=UPI00262F333F|nr:thermonuclease family protein [uncultured Paraglaciecola sp.]
MTRWVDADTAVVLLDLGWNLQRAKQYVRLAHINAPERFTEAGKSATTFVNELCPAESEVYLYSYRDGTGRYKRIVADVVYKGINVNRALADAGHAVLA